MTRTMTWAALIAGSLVLATVNAAANRAEAPFDVLRLTQTGKDAPAAVAHHAEVMVLHATNAKKGIDERIGNMPELQKPPFSAYDSYELLNKARLPLVKGSPKTITLPNGRVLETKLLETLPEDRLRISASINQANGKDFLPLLEVKARVGQAFIVAGQSYKDGILVLVIRVVK
jgi:hypothetical protein